MERNLIGQIKIGEINKIQGFVENLRNKRTMAFLVIRDYSCLLYTSPSPRDCS